MFETDSPAAEHGYAVKCPYCTSHLTIGEDKHDPKPDDRLSCYFHGEIGTRQEIYLAVKAHDLELILVRSHDEASQSVAHHGQLTYDQIKALVKAHNKSGQPDELIIAIAWNESNFMPGSQNSIGTAGGLLGLNHRAIKDLAYNNEISATIDVHNPVENIIAGSLYLALRVHQAHGNLAQALDGYGTGAGTGYGSRMLKAMRDLQKKPSDPIKVLQQDIHK